MVTVVPADPGWGEAFASIGRGVSKGYTERSDENALKKSIGDLGPDASPRQILDAITNTKTHSPAAKQQVLKNYLGVAEFEELQKKHKEESEIRKARNTIEESKEKRAILQENRNISAEKRSVSEEGRKIRQEERNVKLETEQERRRVREEEREVKAKAEERENVKSIVNQLDIPDDQKKALGGSLTRPAAEALLKQQLKPTKEEEAKLTPFERKVQEKNAEKYIELTDEIPKLQSNSANLDYVEQLSKELGAKGVIAGSLGLSGKAKELEGVSFTLMQPIVKMFNPVGPLATKKLETIQNKYVIKATDAPWTKQAKVDALRRFNEQALARAQKKMAMLNKYKGNPPPDVLDSFDKESETIADAMIDYDFEGEEAKIPGMPPAKQYKGEEVDGPNGEVYFSDGVRWTKKK